MRRNSLNYIIDVGLAVTFLSVFVTGVIKFPDLLHYFVRIGIIFPTQIFTTIHKWSGITMGVAVLLHLVLHWKWIVKTTGGFYRRKIDVKTGDKDRAEAVA